MSSNESELFEENDLYVVGNTLKKNVGIIKSEFNDLYDNVIGENISEDLKNDLKYYILIMM